MRPRKISMWTMGVCGPLVAGTALISLGCQLSSPPPIDHAGFMGMWKTYEHCRLSTDAEEILADVEKLKYMAQIVQIRRQASATRSAAIRPFLSPLPSRLSVDPDAMTRACAAHGSEIARAARQTDIETALILATASLATSKHPGADGLAPVIP